MLRREAVRAVVGLLLVSVVLSGCDGKTPSTTSSHSPSAPAPSSTGASAPSPSVSSSSATAKPSATPASWSGATLEMAERQFQYYYYAYVDSARRPSNGEPPRTLLAQTDPDGPERGWLKKSFANGKKSGGHIKSGHVKVTLGPEVSSNGSERTRLKFRVCVDPGDAKVVINGKIRTAPWQLLDVEMHAKPNASKRSRGSDPKVWLVYSKNQISSEKCGF